MDWEISALLLTFMVLSVVPVLVLERFVLLSSW